MLRREMSYKSNKMLYSDIGEIRRKMDDYGAMRKPFLFVIDFEMTEGYFVENPMDQGDIFFEINGTGNRSTISAASFAENSTPPTASSEASSAENPALHEASPDGNSTSSEASSEAFSAEKAASSSGKTVSFAGCPIPSPIPPLEYKSRFDTVFEGLSYGNSFLANLTVATPIQTDMSCADIFMSANAQYLIYIPGRFVCFSPECFVRIANGRVSTFPMKGTIDAATPDAERLIINDFKETAEHNTIVDLLRNDLGRYARNVRVERFRYIDRIRAGGRGILQVSSEITGDLPDDYRSRLGEIIIGMLPAGSVSGAPKASTLNIIRAAEKQPRGYYTGVFGYFDGEVLDSGVMIRFIGEECGRKIFRSGGGITVFSDWEKEYREVLSKIYLPVR